MRSGCGFDSSSDEEENLGVISGSGVSPLTSQSLQAKGGGGAKESEPRKGTAKELAAAAARDLAYGSGHALLGVLHAVRAVNAAKAGDVDGVVERGTEAVGHAQKAGKYSLGAVDNAKDLSAQTSEGKEQSVSSLRSTF